MQKITKQEFLEAIELVRKYVEQEQMELDNLKSISAPIVANNMNEFIDNLELSVRAYNILIRVCRQFFRPEFLHDIPAYRISELPILEVRKARNCGKTTIDEIESALLKHGTALK